MIIFLLIYWGLTSGTDSACTFPTDIRGVWYSTRDGELTFEDSQITGSISQAVGSTQVYTCEFTGSENRYISKANVSFFSTVTGFLYLCMNFQHISSVIYSFTFDTDRSKTNNERVTAFVETSGLSVSESDICTIENDPYPTAGQEIIVKKDSTLSVSCPSILQKKFQVFVGSGSCSGSSLDGQSDTTRLSYTYSSCASKSLFSIDGVYDCVYSFTSGSYTYVTVLNKDNTTDEISTYRFSCYVLERRFQIVYVSEHPQVCQSHQTPKSVISTGRVLAFEDIDPEFKAGSLVAVGVIVSLINIAILTFTAVSFAIWFKAGKYKVRTTHEMISEESEFKEEERESENLSHLAPIQEMHESDNENRKPSDERYSNVDKDVSGEECLKVVEKKTKIISEVKSTENSESVKAESKMKTYLRPDGSSSSQDDVDAEIKMSLRRTDSCLSNMEDSSLVDEYGNKVSARHAVSMNMKRTESSLSALTKETHKSRKDTKRVKPLNVPYMYIDNRKSKMLCSRECSDNLQLDLDDDTEPIQEDGFAPKPGGNMTLSMRIPDQRKMVQFDEDENFTIEVYYKTPEWQEKWEHFLDPCSSSPSTNDGASSKRSVSTLLSTPGFAWADLEADENENNEKMWQKVNKMFPGISKKHFKEAYYEDGITNLRSVSFFDRDESENENKPVIDKRRRRSSVMPHVNQKK